jgi:hypothetical protein
MNHVTKILCNTLLAVFFVSSTTIAQSPDLVLQTEISAQYVAYLDSMETEYRNVLPGGDDTPTMKAHMGLAILQAAQTHVNGDTLFQDLDYLLSEVDDNYTAIISQTVDDIIPLFDADNPNDFVVNLIGFFESGTYPAYRDSIDKWLTENSELYDDIDYTINYFGDKTEPLINAFGEHWDAVAGGTADFEYSVQLMGSQYEDTLFIFSRTFFDRLDMITALGETMAETLDSGFTQILDSLNNNSADIDPGVIVVQAGLDSLNNLIDSIQVLLWSQPFAPLEFELAWMDSLQQGVAEFDTLLSGKTYPIGPEEENKVIRPRGIIESLAHHDGPWGVFQDYYRLGEPASYTFSDIFPEGLTEDMYAMIASDITLNANDSRSEFEAKVLAYQNSLKLKTSLTPDEHFGLALTLTYDLLTDEEYFDSIDEVIHFISEGRIDSLIDTYDWSSFDRQAEIDEIRSHVDQYIDSEDLTNYVILIKENEDGLGSYVLGPNSEFSVTCLTVQHVMMITESIEMAAEAVSMITGALTELYEELDEMFILDLDPTVLDFSDVEDELDVILILEESNPEFLSVTPYGIEKFHEMGEWLQDAFENMGIFYDNLTDLMVAIQPYEDDFDMDAEEMADIMDMMAGYAWEMYEDFAYPDSTTWIDDERVNMSAWFDNPPASFLLMMKDFFMGVDSTMGGMFPDRYKANETVAPPVLPKQFKLYPVYPNPFNPATNIAFDLPEAADIRLTIVNLKGEIVAELLDRHYDAGKVLVTWNASELPSGIYFSRLSINGKIHTRKMTLVK